MDNKMKEEFQYVDPLVAARNPRVQDDVHMPSFFRAPEVYPRLKIGSEVNEDLAFWYGELEYTAMDFSSKYSADESIIDYYPPNSRGMERNKKAPTS